MTLRQAQDWRRDQLFADVRADHRRGASAVHSARDAQAPDRAEAAPGFGHTSTGAAGPLTFELDLQPNVQATLLLAARAAGETPGEFIARAIVFRAQEAVGFPVLADELTGVPEFERRPGSRGGGP